MRTLAARLASVIPPNARVLDVGCGDGAVAALLMQSREDLEVSGIDVFVRPTTHIPVVAFDGHRIPFDDAEFDAVVFVDVLHHTEDPMELLREAVRVAPGAIIVKDHAADGPLARPILRLMDWVGNAHHGVALPYNYWSTPRWQRAVAELGLRTEVWQTSLGLYPPPASWIFERELHLLCRLAAS